MSLYKSRWRANIQKSLLSIWRKISEDLLLLIWARYDMKQAPVVISPYYVSIMLPPTIETVAHIRIKVQVKVNYKNYVK